MFRAVDISVDSEGDLVLDETGDLSLATPQETLQQNLLFRIKTDHHDYGPDPYIGANLHLFVEEPNTRRNGNRIIENIGIALQRNPDVPMNEVFIDAIPISTNQMLVFVAYTGPVDGATDQTIVSYTLEKNIGGVDNESIVNTTDLDPAG